MPGKDGIFLTNIDYDPDHYNYREIKLALFLEHNQKGFLTIREEVLQLLNIAGAVKEVAVANRQFMGNLFGVYAVLDRMVELGEIKEIKPKGRAFPVGDRIFIKNEASD